MRRNKFLRPESRLQVFCRYAMDKGFEPANILWALRTARMNQDTEMMICALCDTNWGGMFHERPQFEWGDLQHSDWKELDKKGYRDFRFTDADKILEQRDIIRWAKRETD